MFLGKRKSGIYFVEYFDEIENKSKRVSTGSKDEEEALKFLANFKTDKIIQPKYKSKSLKVFRDEYLKFISATHSKAYLKSVGLSFSQLEKYFKREISLIQISPLDAQRFITSIYQRAEYSARLYKRTLNAAFNRAVDWEYLTENPFRRVKLGRAKKTFPVFINETQIENILQATVDQTFKAAFQTAFYTGMRLSELINLKWKNVDFTGNVINVINDNTFNTKNKKDRIIPMTEKLANMLFERSKGPNKIKEDDYVFKSKKMMRFNADFLSKSFKDAVRAAGIDDRVHFHTLRHSFASNLVQKGVPLYVVKELLGHEDMSTTQIYSHLNREALRDAVKLL
jgi:site-specific recombinase XerD